MTFVFLCVKYAQSQRCVCLFVGPCLEACTIQCMFVTGHGCWPLIYLICVSAARLPTWNIQGPVKIDLLIWSLFLALSLSSLSLRPDPHGAASKKDANITYQLDDQVQGLHCCCWSSDQWNTAGDTSDHTHTLIRGSDWISHGCLDHYNGFHANW